MKNDDNKFLLRCHVKHLNSLKRHPERIAKVDRRMACYLEYGDIKFPVSKKDYVRIDKKNSICTNVFSYENGLVYPDKKNKDCMYLLLITDDNDSYYVYIKDFNRFMGNKTKHKKNNSLTNIVCSFLVMKKY